MTATKPATIYQLLLASDLNAVARRIYERTGQAPSLAQLQQMARAAKLVQPATTRKKTKAEVKEIELD